MYIVCHDPLKAEGHASLGSGMPVTVLTPATGGQKDSPTTRLWCILEESLARSKYLLGRRIGVRESCPRENNQKSHDIMSNLEHANL